MKRLDIFFSECKEYEVIYSRLGIEINCSTYNTRVIVAPPIMNAIIRAISALASNK